VRTQQHSSSSHHGERYACRVTRRLPCCYGRRAVTEGGPPSTPRLVVSSSRLLMPSLVYTRCRWLDTVRAEMCSSAAIAFVGRRDAASSATWRSIVVSDARADAGCSAGVLAPSQRSVSADARRAEELARRGSPRRCQATEVSQADSAARRSAPIEAN